MKLAPTLLSALVGLAVVSPILALPAEPHGRSGTVEELECDVAILGGGAAGAYAAVRLRDMGKKVIVIEKKSHLVSDLYRLTATCSSAGAWDYPRLYLTKSRD
jgi:NADPH-dependent 2,4-dienoyl-CoA reductase/sulfur reductase-like enzyme